MTLYPPSLLHYTPHHISALQWWEVAHSLKGQSVCCTLFLTFRSYFLCTTSLWLNMFLITIRYVSSLSTLTRYIPRNCGSRVLPWHFTMCCREGAAVIYTAHLIKWNAAQSALQQNKSIKTIKRSQSEKVSLKTYQMVKSSKESRRQLKTCRLIFGHFQMSHWDKLISECIQVRLLAVLNTRSSSQLK